MKNIKAFSMIHSHNNNYSLHFHTKIFCFLHLLKFCGLKIIAAHFNKLNNLKLLKGFIWEEFCGLTSKRGLYEKPLWTDFKKGLYEMSFVDWLQKGFIWEEFCGLASKRGLYEKPLWTDFKKGLYEKSFVDWLQEGFIWEEFCGLTSKRGLYEKPLWTGFKKGLYEKSFEVCLCLWRISYT